MPRRVCGGDPVTNASLQPAQMAKGIFPNITVSEILSALSKWGVFVSQEQLLRPTPDFVEGVYCACMQQVTGISHDSTHEPVQAALAVLDDANYDLYATPLAHNIILYHLTNFAEVARVDDFSARDISHPDRDRTIFLLSAFINFVKFTEQECDAFIQSVREKSDAMIKERDAVSRELQEIQVKIDKMKARIAEDEPRCEELRRDNKTLKTQMFKTKEIQATVVRDVEELRTERNQLLKRKEALNGEIAAVSDTISHTRSRIVQSPERIKRTISTMGSTVNEDKKVVAMQDAKARDLQIKINALYNIEKDVRSCVEQLQTIEKEVHSLEVSQKDLADLKDQLEDRRIERSELILKSERVDKQLSNAHEKLERAQKHAEDKRAASQKTIDRLKREYDEMSIERRDNDKQVEELREEADDVEKRMAEHLKTSEAELNELLTEYWKLRHETDVYMEVLANKLNMRVSSD